MSGLRKVRDGIVGDTWEWIMANSVSFDHGDPVYINSSGFLDVCPAGTKPLGTFADADVTADSDNQTVARTKARYIPLRPVPVFELTSDQDCTDTDVGAYADLAVSGGAYTLNLAAGATGQCLVIGYDPLNESDNDKVHVVFAETQLEAYTQD